MANRGDELLKVLTADFITKLEHLLNLIGRQGVGSVTDPTSHNTITVVNHEAVAKQKFEPVALGTPSLTYTGAVNHRHERIIYNTKALSDSEPDNWVILQEPLPGKIGAQAEALLVGVSWLKTPESVNLQNFVQVDNSGAVYADEGKGYALYSYSDGTDYTTLCILSAKTASSGNALFLVGAGGIPVTDTSVAEPWTLGNASCERLEVIEVSGVKKLQRSGNSETVYNINNLLIPETSIIRAGKTDGIWTAEAVIKKLRVDGFNYQYSLTERTPSWVSWATGSDCPTSSGS